MSEPAYFIVRNWRKFQHYKDRTPPWIKLHWSLISSRDWVMLDDASRVLAVASMLLASRNDQNPGCIPNDPEYVRRVAYLNSDPDFNPLIKCGFLEPASTTLAESTASASGLPQETETDKTLLRNDANASSDDVIWKHGVGLLTDSGVSEIQARSFLGGLRKTAGNESLAEAIWRCMSEKPIEPRAWLTAALTTKKREAVV